MKKIKKQINRIAKHSKEIKTEMGEKTFGFILSGLTVVVGFAWNEAIKEIIEYLFPISKNTIFAKLFYAFMLTGIIVLATVVYNRTTRKKEE